MSECPVIYLHIGLQTPIALNYVPFVKEKEGITRFLPTKLQTTATAIV